MTPIKPSPTVTLATCSKAFSTQQDEFMAVSTAPRSSFLLNKGVSVEVGGLIIEVAEEHDLTSH